MVDEVVGSSEGRKTFHSGKISSQHNGEEVARYEAHLAGVYSAEELGKTR